MESTAFEISADRSVSRKYGVGTGDTNVVHQEFDYGARMEWLCKIEADKAARALNQGLICTDTTISFYKPVPLGEADRITMECGQTVDARLRMNPSKENPGRLEILVDGKAAVDDGGKKRLVFRGVFGYETARQPGTSTIPVTPGMMTEEDEIREEVEGILIGMCRYKVTEEGGILTANGLNQFFRNYQAFVVGLFSRACIEWGDDIIKQKALENKFPVFTKRTFTYHPPMAYVTDGALVGVPIEEARPKTPEERRLAQEEAKKFLEAGERITIGLSTPIIDSDEYVIRVEASRSGEMLISGDVVIAFADILDKA